MHILQAWLLLLLVVLILCRLGREKVKEPTQKPPKKIGKERKEKIIVTSRETRQEKRKINRQTVIGVNCKLNFRHDIASHYSTSEHEANVLVIGWFVDF